MPIAPKASFGRHPAVPTAAVLVIAAVGAVFTAPDEYPVTAVLLLPLGAAAVFGWRVTAALSAVSVAVGAFLAFDVFDGAALFFRLLFLLAGATTIVLIAAGREARERALAHTEELHAIEEELRTSEQRYRSVLEATTSLVVVTDAGGRFTEPQPQWEAYTGQPWDAHREFGWLEAFHVDDRTLLSAAWQPETSPRTVHETRLRLWHAASDAYRWVVVRGAVVRKGNKAVEWIGTVTDQHERIVAELRRAGTEQLRVAVLSSLQDGLYFTNPDGAVVEVNDAWQRITGFTRAEALAARPPYPWWPDEHEHPAEWRALRSLDDHLRTSTDPVEAEVSYRHRAGHLVPTITSVAMVHENDRVRLVVGSVKDITERKASEEALRSERDFREAIMAALQEGILVCSRSGAVLDLNNAFSRITGFSRDETVGVRPPYPWWPDDAELGAELTRDMERAVNGNAAVDAEIPIVRADGEPRLVVVNRQSVRDPATGDFIAVVSTFRDITRRAEAEARLRTYAALTTRLATHNGVAGLANAVLGELMPAVDAEFGAVGLVDTEARVFGVVGAVGLGPEAQARWTRVSLDHPGPLSVSAATLSTIAVHNRAELERRFPAIAATSAERGIEAFVTLPLARGTTPLAVLFLGFRTARILRASDMTLLHGALPIVTQALERARLFEFQTSVASTLQHAMLTEPPVSASDFAIAARYQPAVAELEVGGDWFDVVPLSDARVALVAGDIVGRGLAAAAVMGQLRSALGALAHTTSGASEAISRLDRFARGIPGAMATTVCYGIVDVAARTLRFTTAGHPPPLLVEADGTTRYLDDARAWPVGVGPVDTPRPEAVVDLPAGSTLLFYTDGLVERRGHRYEDGMAALAAHASRSAALPVEELCDELLRSLVSEHPTDDIALVALRLVAPTNPAFTCRVPATPDALAEIRRRLRAWFDRERFPPHIRDDLVLAVGEACTNAVEHAYAGTSPKAVVVEAHRVKGQASTSDGAGVEEAHDHDEIVVIVRDYGSWQPLTPDHRRNRGLHLMAAVTDDLSVTASVSGGTRVRMRRKLASP